MPSRTHEDQYSKNSQAPQSDPENNFDDLFCDDDLTPCEETDEEILASLECLDDVEDTPAPLTLDSSDEAAIEIAIERADVYAEQVVTFSGIGPIKPNPTPWRRIYEDRDSLSQARRSAELAAFQEASERLRRAKHGWSPRSDRELSAKTFDEGQRARKARNQRDCRLRLHPVRPAPAPLPIASVTVTRDEFNSHATRLKTWLALPGHQQRHLRGRAGDIMRAWTMYQTFVVDHRRAPTHAEFAAAFEARFGQPMTRPMVQKRLRLLVMLEADDGPWTVRR